MKKPRMKSVRAIDVVPYRWALWCSVGDDPRPFENLIVHAGWFDDGERIAFGLDSHNGFSAAPDDVLELVPQHGWEPQDADEQHAKFLAARPPRKVEAEALPEDTKR